jgi:NADPH:quinone reductase
MLCPKGRHSLHLITDYVPPPLEAGQVLIRVIAAGINFADGLLMEGRYQTKLAPPFVPGFELSGQVLAVAPDVTSCREGDLVLATAIGGAWAEQCVVPWQDVHVLPANLDAVQAAGFPIAYGTSHLALLKGGLRSGETLVVHGASGGVGLTAVEIGAQTGARVIACASTAEKMDLALQHGATHALDSRMPNLRDAIKSLTDGKGCDLAYDPVGGEAFNETLRSTRAGGRILIIGFASGTIPQVPANILLVKNISLLGFSWNDYRRIDPVLMRQSLHDCIDLWAAGKLRPHVSHILPLDQASQALDLLQNRTATGKVILQVAEM